MKTNQQTLRIATRTSKLALWQAETVKDHLERSGHTCSLVLIESTGDMHLTQPIYAMGISGVFTKQLDIALLDGTADIAVHSLKDVPTQMAQGLTLATTLERGPYQDIAIIKDEKILDLNSGPAVIATSSLRRRAQWLAKYPNHTTAPIRGNVQTRLRKFEENKELSAVIFAKAGLERLGLLPADAVVLDWMIPAPAQGIIGIVCRENDEATKEKCAAINHQDSFIAGHIERQFLRALLGGCSVPISALAVMEGDKIKFKGAMHSFDGSRYFIIEKEFVFALAPSPLERAGGEVSGAEDWQQAGKIAAEELLSQKGAKELLEEIKNKKWDAESSFD
jgi:hydroxymethylbilane synthase